jgi:hypothetical protein
VDDAEPLRFRVASSRGTHEPVHVDVRSGSRATSYDRDARGWRLSSDSVVPADDGLLFPDWQDDVHAERFLVTRERDSQGVLTGTLLLWERAGTSWRLEARLSE